jgi:hypothetical protein
MTLPYERTKAVIYTKTFLLNLCDPKVTPGLPKAIRQEARGLLRHYPHASDLHIVTKCWEDKLMQFTFECPFGDPDDKSF